MAPFQYKQQKYYELASNEDEISSFFRDSAKIPNCDSRYRNPESNWRKFWPWLVHITILLVYTAIFFNGKRAMEIREGFSYKFYYPQVFTKF